MSIYHNLKAEIVLFYQRSMHFNRLLQGLLYKKYFAEYKMCIEIILIIFKHTSERNKKESKG